MKQLLLSMAATLVIGSGITPCMAQTPALKLSGNRTGICQRISPPSDRIAELPQRKMNKSRLSSAQFAQSTPILKSPKRFFNKTVSDAPVIYGSVVYSDDWDYGNPLTGLYSLSLATGGNLEMIAPEADAFNGGVAIGNIYYATTSFSAGSQTIVRVGAYDITSGETLATYYPTSPEAMGIDICLNPVDGKVFGITYNSTADGLQLSELTYTLSDVTVNKIGDLPGNWAAIAASRSGELYGIIKDYESGSSGTLTGSSLVKFDKTNGSYIVIGQTGMKPFYNASACIDPNTNRMFWNVNESNGASIMCEVDLQTGEATPLLELPGNEEVCGMYIPAVDNTDPKTPACVENLTASFLNGSMTGTISFRIPSVLYDGSPADGMVNYTIIINDKAVAEGETTYGSEVEKEVTAATTGENVISVILENGNGQSPATYVSCFIGNGRPERPENVILTYEEGKISIVWDDVLTSADGGYIDPSEITYEIISYPSGETVATDHEATTFTHVITEPQDLTSVYYSVKAKYEGRSSDEGISNQIVLGAYSTPYEEHFDTEDCLRYFTVIDNNNDGKTFTHRGTELTVSYNSSLDMDDYLISPPVRLEAGNSYHISIDARNEGTRYGERFELLIGTAPDIESMTHILVPPTEMLSGVYTTYGADFIPAQSGKYYIGVHGCSDKDKNVLYITNLVVGDGLLATVPSAPSEFTAVADASGDHLAKLSGIAPLHDLAGNELPAIEKMELYRGETLIKVFDTVTPGSTVEYTDTPVSAGEYVYGLVAYSASGKGSMARTSCFVGVDIPSVPENIKVEEPSGDGNIIISWDAVEKDWKGNPLNTEKVTYTIYEIDNVGELGEPIAEEITSTEYSFQAIADTSVQSFVQFGVTADSESGSSPVVGTGLFPVGPAYPGMTESFGNGSLSYIFGLRGIAGQGMWQIFNDSSFTDVVSQDGDNGFLAFHAYGYNDSMGIHTGKIGLAGFEHPSLTYYVYPVDDDDENLLQIYVREVQGEWEALAGGQVNQLGEAKRWNRVVVPLNDYVGKDIQIEFVATCKGIAYTLLDNISVGETPAHDLVVKSINAPERVNCEENYEVSVTVANEGAEQSGDYTIELYNGDTLLSSIPGTPLAQLERMTAVFDLTMGKFEVSPINLHAVVAYDADDVPSNNVSDEITILPVGSNLPMVENLKAEVNEQGVTLSWDLPQREIAAEGTLYDLEDAEAFAHEYEGWTFVDVDESPVAGMANVTLPGITPGITTSSFFVVDSTDEQFNESFDAHSGTKYLASLVRYDDKQVDDWAISPELSGSAQTISFWGKSYHPSYLEKVEVWVSQNGTAVDDFELLSTIPAVPYAWTEYTFELPEGSRHFALRSCAVGAFMLMIDDITFTKAGETQMLDIIGYNVYRDEAPLNARPVADTIFNDTSVEKGIYTYIVTPLFNLGEGKPAFIEVNTELTGIETPTDYTLQIRKNGIRISGATDLIVRIVTADGMTVYSDTVTGNAEIELTSGVYIVNTGNSTRKVMIP